MKAYLARLEAEITKLEDTINELLESSDSDSDTDSGSESDSDGEPDALEQVEELEEDLKRCHAQRGLMEERLKVVELRAKHTAKLQAQARRRKAVEARSADLLSRVRAAADGGDSDEAVRSEVRPDGFRSKNAAPSRSLRRQM